MIKVKDPSIWISSRNTLFQGAPRSTRSVLMCRSWMGKWNEFIRKFTNDTQEAGRKFLLVSDTRDVHQQQPDVGIYAGHCHSWNFLDFELFPWSRKYSSVLHSAIVLPRLSFFSLFNAYIFFFTYITTSTYNSTGFSFSLRSQWYTSGHKPACISCRDVPERKSI